MSNPWSDCKLAFDYLGRENVLEELHEKALRGEVPLPGGWQLIETDSAGARVVVVFRVDGHPRLEDGFAVRILLDKLGVCRTLAQLQAVLTEMVDTGGWASEVKRRTWDATRAARG